jgi:hypothetical protein
MKSFMFALGFAALAIAAPLRAQAQDMWRHGPSGVSIAREIGEMRLREERDNSNGVGADVYMQFGSGGTTVTFYVYRSAYPNVALWFERTRLAMQQSVGSGGTAVAPRPFTLGSSSSANGLREELDVPPANLMRARATAVAMAQVGQWIVKARVTSSDLDRAGVTALMDQLLAAVQLSGTAPPPLPLAVPSVCTEDVRMRGDRIGNVRESETAAALMAAVLGDAEARGGGGLASDPQSWCRMTTTEVPIEYGTVYRRRDGGGWVALLGDSGRAAAALALDAPGRARAGLIAITPASTQTVAVYDGIPDPDQAVPVSLPVVVGQATGMVQISTSGPEGRRPGD